jgi:hypothetical protein
MMKALPMLICACASLLIYLLLISNGHNFYIRANINLTKALNNLY